MNFSSSGVDVAHVLLVRERVARSARGARARVLRRVRQPTRVRAVRAQRNAESRARAARASTRSLGGGRPAGGRLPVPVTRRGSPPARARSPPRTQGCCMCSSPGPQAGCGGERHTQPREPPRPYLLPSLSLPGGGALRAAGSPCRTSARKPACPRPCLTQGPWAPKDAAPQAPRRGCRSSALSLQPESAARDLSSSTRSQTHMVQAF